MSYVVEPQPCWGFLVPRTGAAVQQQKEVLEVEYRFDPIPDADERLSHALDAIVRLILLDLAQDPGHDGRAEPTEGVQ